VTSTLSAQTPLTHIRALIDAQGRRMDWLAEQVGISQSYLTHILAGRRPLLHKHAVKLASALQTTVAYIESPPRQPAAVAS
jgi:antitoxin component HigA of HigAB toxin-antitoxin module